jgi:hypothetical protein
MLKNLFKKRLRRKNKQKRNKMPVLTQLRNHLENTKKLNKTTSLAQVKSVEKDVLIPVYNAPNGFNPASPF